MDHVSVIPYEPEYHERAKHLFKYGMYEHFPNAIRMNLTSLRNLGVTFTTFILGLILDSWQMGLFAVMLTMALQALSVEWCFSKFVKKELNTNMKDEELKYWTTEPNVYLVAKTSTNKIIGTIAYKVVSEYNAEVEMCRCIVDPDFRRLGIGSLLMGHLSALAKSKGYKTISLITSSQNVSTKFYEYHGFKLKEIIYPTGIISLFTTLHDLKYEKCL